MKLYFPTVESYYWNNKDRLMNGRSWDSDLEKSVFSCINGAEQILERPVLVVADIPEEYLFPRSIGVYVKVPSDVKVKKKAYIGKRINDLLE